MRATACLLLLGASLLAPAAGHAHSFLPAVVELHLGAGDEHELRLRPPRLPPGDDRRFEASVGPPCTLRRDGGGRTFVRCAAGVLLDTGVAVIDLAGGDPLPDVLLDVRWPDGRRGLGGVATRAPAGRGAASYLALGVEHILGGLDHLLFVVGLCALVGARAGRLAATVTAFTAGHSLTLAAVALGALRPAQAPIEILIAVTLLFLGRGLATPARGEGIGPRLAFVFGLVHGAGFAGALADVGLPPADAVLALALFNLGVEVGQLLVVALVLALATAARPLALDPRRPIGYALGATAAVLLLQRLPLLVTG
jgi:hypothetical protein